LLQKLVEAPWEDKEFYANWLSQTYYFVSNSTRLISLAGSLFPDNMLHHRFVDHAKEERNHELLLTNDLKHLGKNLQNEFASTSGFYQSQVFWMFFRSPASFFGYILCLEGIAVDYGQKAFDRVKAAHGLKASNFLKVHSEEDVDHLDKAFELLERMTPEQRQHIEQNLRQCVAMYTGILEECMKKGRVALRSVA
jgi:thiaminase